MIIIGEKINGSIPSVGEAIARRDAEFIKNLAIKQSECHSDFLDISASVSSDMEEETIAWLIACAQEVSEAPLCIDSPDPEMIRKVFPLVNKAGMINSVSDEGEKCEILFPLLKDNDWQIMALTCNDKGIPSGNDEKVEIAVKLIEKGLASGFPFRSFTLLTVRV
ncbi:MAG: hypothetical protein HGA54_08955 [Actinobacteria bacterium]|nr:hypothetical protein [Actinomycetota bacterium]